MYCPRCSNPIEEDEQTCAYCDCELGPKRSRVKISTIIVIFASVVLLAAIVFFSLKILDFVQNPTPRPAVEEPTPPTGPPQAPLDEPESMHPPVEPTTARVNAAGGLRMRENPGVDYDIVLLIPNYEYITILQEEGGWALVEYGGASGWVSTGFLLREDDARFWEEPEEPNVTPGTRSPAPVPARINAENGLRMRMGPGADYHVVLIIPHDEAVPTHDQRDGWVYVEHLGHWGWVNAAFLLAE